MLHCFTNDLKKVQIILCDFWVEALVVAQVVKHETTVAKDLSSNPAKHQA